MRDARVMDTQEVLEECVRFPSYGDRYYQITAIDEYSRKRLEKKHMQRYNSTDKTSLNFSPNEIVSEYFSKCNICLDN